MMTSKIQMKSRNKSLFFYDDNWCVLHYWKAKFGVKYISKSYSLVHSITHYEFDAEMWTLLWDLDLWQILSIVSDCFTAKICPCFLNLVFKCKI